jgi:hypothetical protein
MHKETTIENYVAQKHYNYEQLQTILSRRL